ncbi:MAG TPA: ABC transporter ATP-binding protein [Candidatus Anaerostipes avistercoris]|uniref:ABC transporter ATP-binding protein n=1 Tax=Candidatus Anaerostipes avistercoris TaxID=2838462 RepID=A0A9D2TAC2_9FIRM|nr:ABC transporter ATP-binding protein [uncultured Anaerostipes sp.]HJC51151.1 ABC transporter ATP-binding protein [Candidatus Anaerostipes avistercoris]
MNAVEMRHVEKNYGQFQIRDLNLCLPSGYIMGLIGENGAGKSTTIKMILNLIRMDQGEIRVFGEKTEDSPADSKEEIGIVLDESQFPEGVTVEQVNKIMKSIYKKWDEEEFYRLTDYFSLPRKKKRFKEFSRGMQRKLSIAVAMAHNAKLLILDEPTSGLDPVVRDEILDLFNDFTRDENHSILISSHIVGDLEKLCDYVAFIQKGRLIICEEKDQLLESYGILKCSEEELAELDEQAVAGVRDYGYGVEALVEKCRLPEGYQTEATSLEDIIIFLSKRERRGMK